MPGRPICNARLGDLPADVRDRFLALSAAKRYLTNLLVRAVVQVRAKKDWTFFVDGYIALVGKRWVLFLERKRWANCLRKRKVLQLPQWTEVEELLPAAILADRARELRQASRLRLVSGKEITVKYNTGATLHDFYVNARRILNVPRGVSLALLRPGFGIFEQRLLPCHRRSDAYQWVKGRVFEVVQHK